MMDTNTREQLRTFIRTHRQATLAVIEDGEPMTAMVSYALSDDDSALLIHLSNLSSHKRALMAHAQCSVLIAAPDDGRAEVLSLPRVSIQGNAMLLSKSSAAYAQAKSRYLARLPASELMFSLPDFDLFGIRVLRGRYVAGFGRAMDFAPTDIKG